MLKPGSHGGIPSSEAPSQLMMLAFVKLTHKPHPYILFNEWKFRYVDKETEHWQKVDKYISWRHYETYKPGSHGEMT